MSTPILITERVPKFPAWFRTRGIVKSWIYFETDKRPFLLDNFDAWCLEKPNCLEDIPSHPKSLHEETLPELTIAFAAQGESATPTPITDRVRAIAAEAAKRHKTDILGYLIEGEDKDAPKMETYIFRAIITAIKETGAKEALEQLLPRYAEMFMACNLGNPATDSMPYQEGHAALAAINELENPYERPN